VSYNNKRKR